MKNQKDKLVQKVLELENIINNTEGLNSSKELLFCHAELKQLASENYAEVFHFADLISNRDEFDNFWFRMRGLLRKEIKKIQEK